MLALPSVLVYGTSCLSYILFAHTDVTVIIGFENTEIVVEENAGIVMVCVELRNNQIFDEGVSVEVESNDQTAISCGTDCQTNQLS